MLVTSSVLLGSGSFGKSGSEGRFFLPPPQRNLLRKELPLSPAFCIWINKYKANTSYDIVTKTLIVLFY